MMIKFLVAAVGLLAVLATAEAENFCVGNENPTAFKDIDWKSMSDNSKCVAQTKEQIKLEMQASYAYLAMGAHFSKDSVNRPGFANFFFTAAGEEREHGRKLIEYMLMRGEFVKNGVPDVSEIKFNKLNNTVPANLYTEQFAATGLEALQAALKLEVKVTRSIKDLIAVCEEETKDNPNNDYHFVDYLTGEFLEEQYHGQRELAGKISTLSKMIQNSPSVNLAEFLFDKKNF